MKKLILIIASILSLAVQAKPVWIEFKGFDPVIEEILFNDIKTMSKGIVDWRRDYAFGFDKGVSFDGGITVVYTDKDESRTSGRYGFNIEEEKIYVPLISIGEPRILAYSERNRIFALKNSTYHEIFCHVLPRLGNDGHTTWGLCRQFISTDKLYWNRRHKRKLKKLLDTNFKTGIFLNKRPSN